MAHASCPNCNNTRSGDGVYRCYKCGSIYCDACARTGLVHNYCPKCQENSTGQKLGTIQSR